MFGGQTLLLKKFVRRSDTALKEVCLEVRHYSGEEGCLEVRHYSGGRMFGGQTLLGRMFGLLIKDVWRSATASKEGFLEVKTILYYEC